MKLLRQLLALAVGVIIAPRTSCLPIENSSSEPLPDVTLTVQTKKLTNLVDERFLSMTVDPVQLLRHAIPGPGAVRVLSMASAMSPAYLRIAGPSTENISFEGGPTTVGSLATVQDQQWPQLQTLSETAGLRPILALSAHRRPGAGSRWDSRDAMRALAAADASAVTPAGWQLGYDWKTMRTAGVQPSQAASDVNTLRNLIEEFPTLSKEPAMLFGPDVEANVADAEAAAEMAKNANLAAVVVRPFTTDDPTGAKLDRDTVMKALGRGQTKKPLWLAESGEVCTAPFSSGLLWAQRLCTATRVAAQVILRELDLDAVRDSATPDLWVSLLHKTLTSRGVLDARATGADAANDLSISSHCTPTDLGLDKNGTIPNKRLGLSAIRYDPGAVTVMAVNPTNRNLRVSLRVAGAGNTGVGAGTAAAPPDVLAAADVGTLVHEFVLTAPNDDMNATSTLLNGSPVQMASGGAIPNLSPRQLQLNSSLLVSLPPHSVAFWVIPGAKARACLVPPASDDVAPAGSRLRPLSARDVELGVHLDDENPLTHDVETPREPEVPETHDTDSDESGENSFIKDLRRRRKKLSRTPTTPRLSLPRFPVPATPRFRPSDFSLAGLRSRTQKEPELKTLDDLIREELKQRPKIRSPVVDLPTLKLEPPSMLSPLKLDFGLDGLIGQNTGHDQGEGGRKKRSSDGDQSPSLFDDSDGDQMYPEEDETPREFDGLRFKRKALMDYVKEELKRKDKKVLTGQHKQPAPKTKHPEGTNRPKGELSRPRRFVPEEIGLRFKRKPLAVPDFLTLPKLPRKPLLSPAAKRAQMLLSLDNPQPPKTEEALPNQWGTSNRQVFPEGDVFAEDEGTPDEKSPDVDYVTDDDYPVPSTSRTHDLKSQDTVAHSPKHDSFYYAPSEVYEATSKRRPASNSHPKGGEFGELEHLPGTHSPNIDDAAADGFRVVPAAKPSKELEKQLQAKVREDLERHYAEVQKAAADRKAQVESQEDDEEAPEESMDLESLRSLGEKYLSEKKMNLPDEAPANVNGLSKQDEPKEMGKTEVVEKSRRRRDVSESSLHLTGGPSASSNTPRSVKQEAHSRLHPRKDTKRQNVKGKDISFLSKPSVTDDAMKRRQEKIRVFKERVAQRAESNNIRQMMQTHSPSVRHKRAVKMYEFPSTEGHQSDEAQTSKDNPTERYVPVTWDSTGGSIDFSAPRGDLWPYNKRYHRFGLRSPQDEYQSVYPQPLSYFPEGAKTEGSSNSKDIGRSSTIKFDPIIGTPSSSSEEIFLDDSSYDPFEARTSPDDGSAKLPHLVVIPWDVSLPNNMRFKRSADNSPSEMNNRLIQESSSTPSPTVDIEDALRELHKILTSSKDSVEVHNGRGLIDDPETLDSLEDTIEILLNMTKHLNETMNRDNQNEEIVSWSELGLEDTIPAARLDSEEAKFRDTGLAWLHAVKTGAIHTPDGGKDSERTNGTTPDHMSVKKQLSGDDRSQGVAKKLAHEKNLTEQENIVSAMMQRVSALLDELRDIFNKKDAQKS